MKWSSKTEIHRPGFIEGRPPPQGDPLRNIPKEKIMHTDVNDKLLRGSISQTWRAKTGKVSILEDQSTS